MKHLQHRRGQKIGVALDEIAGNPELGVLVVADHELEPDAFIAALVKHRHPVRDTDPPRI